MSSSTLAAQMTHQTVIGVRYPELVSTNPTGCTFGRFDPPEPHANLHAVVGVGAVVQFQVKFSRGTKSSLAVVHNQNDIVTHFKASSWVSEAQVSRGVTTLLLSLGRLSMVLGMCSRVKPTSIFTGALFGIVHLMQALGICWRGPTAFFHYTLLFLRLRIRHLIVVGIWSPWKYNTAQVGAVTDLMKHLADTPEMRRMVPLMAQEGRPRCRRSVYGHPLDQSEFPCYVFGPVWSIGLSIPWLKAAFSCPLKLNFAPWGLMTSIKPSRLKGKANPKQDALVQFRLMEAELTSDLRLTAAALLCMSWSSHEKNLKLLLRVQQGEIGSHLVSFPQISGKEEQGVEEEEANGTCTDSEDSSSEEQDGSLKILLPLPISMGSC